MATNTATGIGIRLDFSSLGARNYENRYTGPVQYASNRVHLEYLGTLYEPGDSIPFDAGGATYYSDDALMEEYFNAGWLTPLT